MTNTTESRTTQKQSERKIGKTTYRITSFYLGETDLKDSLERLAVRKVLDEINADTKMKMRA